MLRYNRQALQTFPQFTQLPKEIREIIFRHALPGSRIVEVHIESGIRSLNIKLGSGTGRWKSIWIGQPAAADIYWEPPALLLACHESRSIAKSVFDHCFAFTPLTTATFVPPGTYQSPIEPSQITTFGVPFQPAYDTIYIPPKPPGMIRQGAPFLLVNSMSEMLHVGDIRSLAVHAEDISDPALWDQCFSSLWNYTAGLRHEPLSPRSSLPWLESIQELFLIAKDAKKAGALKASMVQRMRRESMRPIPTICILSLNHFRSLQRWERRR